MELLTKQRERDQYDPIRDESEGQEGRLSAAELLTSSKKIWCRDSVLALLGMTIAALLYGYLAGSYNARHQVNDLEGPTAL